MSSIEWCEKTAVITLPSVVTLETLPALLKQAKNSLSLSVKTVDFSAVKQADSAVLALLLIWSKNSSPPIQVLELPQSLQGLIALYDLESMVGPQS
ncbi:MAG: STAS domain-containing protein [Thiomicrorhabdus sp.]|nr:STAS domain-containing protein [Thiomicrorhabdus sp.]